jgi:hypothetical protein
METKTKEILKMVPTVVMGVAIVAAILVGAFVTPPPTPSVLEQVKAERTKKVSEQEKRRQEAVLIERQDIIQSLSNGNGEISIYYEENVMFFQEEGFAVFSPCETTPSGERWCYTNK